MGNVVPDSLSQSTYQLEDVVQWSCDKSLEINAVIESGVKCCKIHPISTRSMYFSAPTSTTTNGSNFGSATFWLPVEASHKVMGEPSIILPQEAPPWEQ